MFLTFFLSKSKMLFKILQIFNFNFVLFNIENSNGRSVSVSGSELVVCRLHRFAVTSPRSQEFYDRILARIENMVVEIGVGELFGERNGNKRGSEAEHF